MRLQRIQELVHHRPWLITPTGHEAIRDLIDRKLTRDLFDGAEPQAGFIEDMMTPRAEASVENGVGFVHISGPIGVGLSRLEKKCGATDLRDLSAELNAVQEQGAERIMLIVDSPGGTVGGVPEVADQIASLAVPVFAFVPEGAMNCSAAYYLTSGADRVYASSSADVGSIGVYLPWVDRTAAFAAMGYKVELITNKEGDLKGTGYPGTALTDAQREDLQAGVQEIFDDFAAHVRAHRGTINSDTMRGQSFSAREAKRRNLTDGVNDYAAVLRTLKRFRRED